MLITRIGQIELEDGTDWYYLLENPEDNLSADQAREWFLPQVYRDTSSPGGLFCHNVRVIAEECKPNQVICIAEVRRDW